jgi:hypothetical protein
LGLKGSLQRGLGVAFEEVAEKLDSIQHGGDSDRADDDPSPSGIDDEAASDAPIPTVVEAATNAPALVLGILLDEKDTEGGEGNGCGYDAGNEALPVTADEREAGLARGLLVTLQCSGLEGELALAFVLRESSLLTAPLLLLLGSEGDPPGGKFGCAGGPARLSGTVGRCAQSQIVDVVGGVLGVVMVS